jgi:hypothetical protein
MSGLAAYAHAENGQGPALTTAVAEPKYAENGQPLRWAKPEITIAFDNSLDQIGAGARDAVKLAFGTWLSSGAKLPALQFTEQSGLVPKLERDGINAVLVAPITIADHTNDLAATISFTDEKTGRLVEADLVINQNHEFGVLDADEASPADASDDDPEPPLCRDRYDLQDVATHEAGHFFGLGEDLGDVTATMYFMTARCESKKRDLAGPDSDAMTSLYAENLSDGETRVRGCNVAHVVSGSASANSPAFLVAALLALGAATRTSRQSGRTPQVST